MASFIASIQPIRPLATNYVQIVAIAVHCTNQKVEEFLKRISSGNQEIWKFSLEKSFLGNQEILQEMSGILKISENI